MASRDMLIKGTAHKDGGYTVTVSGPKAMRRLALAVFARTTTNRRVASRSDRYIIFGPKEN